MAILAIVTAQGEPASAQQVSLSSPDGTSRVGGQLVSYKDGVYVVDTVIGEITVNNPDTICTGPGCPKVLPAIPVGGPVTLRAGSTGLEISGRLVAYENGAYTIETAIGTLDIVGEGVTCSGDGCPGASGKLPQVSTTAAATPPAVSSQQAPDQGTEPAPDTVADTAPVAAVAPAVPSQQTPDQGAEPAPETAADTAPVAAVAPAAPDFAPAATPQIQPEPGPAIATAPESDFSAPTFSAPEVSAPEASSPATAPAQTATSLPGADRSPIQPATKAPQTASAPDSMPVTLPEALPERGTPSIAMTQTAAPIPPTGDSEVSDGNLVPLVSLAAPADTVLAGAASVIGSLMPMLAEDFAIAGDADVAPLPVKMVSPDIAEDAGYPAGARAMRFTLSDGSDGPVVLSRLIGAPEQAEDLLTEGSAELAFLALRTQDPRQRQTDWLVGHDALLAVVAPNNPVSAISAEDLAAVYAGKITRWTELGGDDAEIRIFALPPVHDLSVAAEQTLLATGGQSPRVPDRILPDPEALAEAVAQEPLAIGFVSSAYLGEARALDITSSCGISTAATDQTILTGRYPFARDILARSRPDPEPAAFSSAMLAHLLDNTDRVTAAAGMLPPRMERYGLDADIALLDDDLSDTDAVFARQHSENAQRMMSVAERLSTVLRFDAGSNRLDAASRRALVLLIHYAARNQLKELFLVGFTEHMDDIARAAEFSRVEAQLVRQQIEQADTDDALAATVLRTVGLGPLMPVACPGAADELARNRRVEVWVRR